jgi:hypothetical protein
MKLTALHCARGGLYSTVGGGQVERRLRIVKSGNNYWPPRGDLRRAGRPIRERPSETPM